MRCPHCGYNSFAHLEHCKKCGREMKRKSVEGASEEMDSVSSVASESIPTPDAEAPGAGRHREAEDGDHLRSRTEGSIAAPDAEQENPAPLFDAADYASSNASKSSKTFEGYEAQYSGARPETDGRPGTEESRPDPVSDKLGSTGGSDHEDASLESGYLPWESSLLPDVSPAAERTPNQKYALIRRRLFASVFDIAVILGVWLLFYIWGHNLLWESEAGFVVPLLHSPRARGGFYLLLVLIALAYFVLFHYANGQTPGKIITKIRVVSCDAEPLTLTQVLLRTCGGFVSALLLGAGYIAICWGQDARGWNDKLADTRVEFVPAEDLPTP